MTVKELIEIANKYNPESEVRVAMRHWLGSVDKIKSCVDMNTNKTNMVIIVED